jgi:hypothetical protein
MAPTTALAKRALTEGYTVGSKSAYRRVWKTPHGKYVYKELRYEDDTESMQANNREYATYLRLLKRTLPAGIFLPKMYLLDNGVLAVEYISGFHPIKECSSDCDLTFFCKDHGCWRDRIRSLRIRDLHDNNVRMNGKGEVFLIDIDGGFTTDPHVCGWDVDKESLGR